jgi:hypothetical protein
MHNITLFNVSELPPKKLRIKDSEQSLAIPYSSIQGKFQNIPSNLLYLDY